ncbi:MAG TPA: nicotinate-nucleotide adenylyltransferase [Acidimicrobiales bacterium]
MRLGIFGGTFDPIHNGHLVAAVNARHDVGLDRVLIMPAHVPWQKVGHRAVTPAADRLAMVAAAVTDVDGLEASDLEVRRGGWSYTADTVEALAVAQPAAGLFVILGADAVAGLGTWERAETIRALASLVVVNRPGAGAGAVAVPPGWRGVTIEIPALDLSSTDLRARAAAGRPLDYLVPPGAIRYLRERGLYAGGHPDEPHPRPAP